MIYIYDGSSGIFGKWSEFSAPRHEIRRDINVSS